MDFSEKLKKLRKKKGWTQKEVAQKIGVSTRTYASYELEGREPKDVKTFYVLSEVFGVSRDYFIESSKSVVKIDFTKLFHNISGMCGSPDDRADTLTNELITMFLENELSAKTRDRIAERIMNVYWEAKRADKQQEK